MKIILDGFMGSGKTTIGQLLATELQLSFWDLDHLISATAQKSISAIFQDSGEKYFRSLETKALKEVLPKNGVLALGGGTSSLQENRQLLQKDSASVILLEAQNTTLWQRINATATRPLAKSQAQITALKRQRQAYYEQMADLIITTDHCFPKQVVQQIKNTLVI
ncbi:shikimate kinase [Bombilactobacillus thymidiniphilus]|uniref:Shikimate kinase n=1 Tax=Bombilactobacillus thymidiniphilus TaxID=2923363 RepID=A0ABY4PE47_9LACO|nr:shikimate kinase [Bombilactobacillus thymidiniphilus]UQS83954.1 shikimate kinase [Bombilactobacillus thymidiniphilus]